MCTKTAENGERKWEMTYDKKYEIDQSRRFNAFRHFFESRPVPAHISGTYFIVLSKYKGF